MSDLIIDSHCHIASLQNTPRSFIQGVIDNMEASLSARGARLDAKTLEWILHRNLQDESCDELVREMDEAGISRSVLLAADFTFALKDCRLTVEETFLKHREVLLRHPGRFEVFGGVDPRWGADGLALFERSLRDLGFRGLKVYPPCGFSPSDPMLYPFYELCQAHRVPVVVHIGPTSPALSFESANPFLIDGAARSFPRVNFILAHGGVSFVEQCVMMCRFRPNVFLDISGYENGAGDLSGGTTAVTLVRRIVSCGINHKVLFGTDWPLFRLQNAQKAFVQALLDETHGAFCEVSAEERQWVLGGNIERLLAGAMPHPDHRPY
jgi:predicted TIM-barrel fold metal-dependent hydrolase